MISIHRAGAAASRALGIMESAVGTNPEASISRHGDATERRAIFGADVRGRLLRFFVRTLVSVHFMYELVDKFRRFNYWNSVILDQTGMGTWALMLVVLLLVIGVPLLLVGVKTQWAAISLAIFQIPTTILFENDNYERTDSLSALGGVFAVALFESHLRQETCHLIECQVENTPSSIRTYGCNHSKEPLLQRE